MAELWGGRELRRLLIHEPWATCIAKHGKNVENRGWKPNDDFDGFIAVHTAYTRGSVDIAALHYLHDTMGLFPELFPDGRMLSRAEVRSSFLLGCVIAVARFGGVIPPGSDGGRWHNRNSYGWVLEDVRAVEPCSMTGSRGLRLVTERQSADLWKRYTA
jgi:hypothetical protein